MKNIHEGRNVKRFREMMGLKQEALAYELGSDWTQKRVSLLESKESIEFPVLQQVSDILKIPVEALQNFDEEQAVSFIGNTIDNGAVGYQRYDSCTINPLDKIIALHDEKIALYERMLKEKEEMMERLERLIGKNK